MKHFLPLLTFCFISANLNAQLFIDKSQELGFDHSFQPRALMGGGVAFFDFENDGDQDFYINGGLTGDRIYNNNGDGTFTKIASDIGLGATQQYNTTGAITGDIDNDGDREIFVTTWEKFANGSNEIARNLIFLNNGDGTFTEIGNEAGITHPAFSIGANFLDYNKDGFLDIYVINHVNVPAFLYDDNGVIIGFDHECYPNFLYKNNGDNTFTEVSTDAGLGALACGLASMPTDFDADGDLDILIANDFGPFLTPNELYQNNYPENNFSEIGDNVGAGIPMYGMGIAAADYDHDQDLDYYITNLGANVLMENNSGTFTDVAASAQVENTYAQGTIFSTGWGTAFFDIDNDSWDDLFVANGRIPSLASLPTASNDPNKLYSNNGDKTFTDISENAGIADEDYNRGMAYADVDNDGDLDFIVIAQDELGGKSKIYFNQSDNDNHYVQFKLIGVESNRDAYGSKAWVYAGGEVFIKELVGGGASHVSQHTSIIHFGLGSINQIDSVRIEWPNGIVDHLANTEIDQLHTIEEGSTLSNVEDLFNNEFSSIKISPNPFTDYISINNTATLQNPVRIELINSTGQLVFNMKSRLNKNTIIPIPSFVPAGIYLLNIKTTEGSISKKVLKMK